MSRWFHSVALLVLAALGACGCRTCWDDLSAPAEWTPLGGPPVVVADARGVLPVVFVESPENRWAALFLVGVLKDMCGRRPMVVSVLRGQSPGVTKALFVGDGARAAGDESFRVVARDGSVRFLGRADYAVFDWCERELGMRWYCDGGQCVERRGEIVARAVEYSDAPAFDCRMIGGNAAWARVAKAGSSHRGGVNVHAPQRWIDDRRVVAEHPEIFENGQTPMLCYGKPATLAYYQRRIDRHLAGLEDSGGIVDTNRQVVTVCQWDAPIACRCKFCRGLYDGEKGVRGAASPIIWGSFLPALAEWLRREHPGCMISFLPYLNTCLVPGNLRKLPDLCEAEVCTMPGLALLKETACRRREEGLLRDWRRVTGRKVLNWHYGCWPLEWTSAPYVFGRTVRRHYDGLRDVTAGSFVCGGEGDPRIALSMYVWSRCLWNPDVDVEAIYDGFARRMFGAGAEPMRELIALQEACWERQWNDDKCTARNVFETSYPPEDVRRMRELLRQAVERIRRVEDDQSLRRLNWYASGFVRFFAESDALEGRPQPVLRPGEPREMVMARDALSPTPWARTTVSFEVCGTDLVFTLRCAEPAAGKMDFSRHDLDFVHGDDCVTFVVEDEGMVRTAKVFKDGTMEGACDWRCSAKAGEDAWTAVGRIGLSTAARASGCVRGNVSRWRVGDMKAPKDSRVPGSRYELSRLSTCFTQLDDDPAAFVRLKFEKVARIEESENLGLR